MTSQKILAFDPLHRGISADRGRAARSKLVTPAIPTRPFSSTDGMLGTRLGRVAVRVSSSADAPALGEYFRHLSKTSLRMRFMSSLSQAPASFERLLRQVDGKHHFALVAERHGIRSAEIVGEARFIVDENNPSACEFALSVTDNWQGKGLGTTLLHGLRARAQLGGLHVMRADTLAGNKAAIALFKLFGFNVGFNPEDPCAYCVTGHIR